jgi:8-oxo-dGTP pyrophosphatase MutT (NUDIX family)
MKKAESAGIIIVRRDITDNGVKVLLMNAYSFWDFPKGGIEENESKLHAAIREVGEETGIVNLDFYWGKTYYQTESFGKNRKTVYYFIAKTDQKDIVMGISPLLGKPEHEDYKWVSFTEAKKMTVERIQKALIWAEERIELIYDNKGI